MATQSPSLAAIYLDRLAQFEGRKFCSVKEAATYLNIDRQTLDPLLKTRVIKTRWQGYKLHQVEIASLLEYVDKMPIDRPEPKVRS